jgi:polar amino acid transport system substrate-binding protein
MGNTMIRPTLRSVGLALAFLALGTTPAAAETVALATGNGYAPFTDESLPGGGVATQLVRQVVERMGLTPEIRFLPWKRALDSTAAGEFVATFPYIRSTERGTQFLYSAPLFEVDNRVFVRKSDTRPVRRVEDLAGRTACNQLGSAHPHDLQQLIDSGKVRLETPKDLESCFKMLALGRADFVSINEFVGRHALHAALGDSAAVDVAGPPLETVGLYLLVPRHAPGGEAFLRRFDAAMAAWKRSPAWTGMQQSLRWPQR